MSADPDGESSPRRGPMAIVAVVVAGLALLALMLVIVVPSAIRAAFPVSPGATAQASGPSAAAQMICAAGPQRQIAAALGATPNQSLSPTWVGDVYSCTYSYDAGDLVLSVHDLSSTGSAHARFDELRADFSSTITLDRLGDGGFQTEDGSRYVLKDQGVLVVDVGAMSPDFGPGVGRAEIAERVADVILKCWTEHF